MLVCPLKQIKIDCYEYHNLKEFTGITTILFSPDNIRNLTGYNQFKQFFN